MFASLGPPHVETMSPCQKQHLFIPGLRNWLEVKKTTVYLLKQAQCKQTASRPQFP